MDIKNFVYKNWVKSIYFLPAAFLLYLMIFERDAFNYEMNHIKEFIQYPKAIEELEMRNSELDFYMRILEKEVARSNAIEAERDSLESILAENQRIDFIKNIPKKISLDQFSKVLQVEPRAGFLLPVIHEVCNDNNEKHYVPHTFMLSIADTETDFATDPMKLISWCGAGGTWQLMPETGKAGGLKVFITDDYLEGRRLWKEYRKLQKFARTSLDEALVEYKKMGDKSLSYQRRNIDLKLFSKWYKLHKKAEEKRGEAISRLNKYRQDLYNGIVGKNTEEINNFDQRFDLQKSSRVARSVAADLLLRAEGDIRLAFYGYNVGPSKMLFYEVEEGYNYQEKGFLRFKVYTKAVYGSLNK